MVRMATRWEVSTLPRSIAVMGELHDVYLQPFKRVVTSLPIHAVMSTYNSWNRVPNSSSHYLLTEVLRNRWGFQGYIYSDWGAIDMLHTFQRTASNQAEAAVQALLPDWT